MYREEATGASFALGLFAGAVIGAGVALLFAPKTGQETRELLCQQYRGLAERVNDATADLRQQGRERAQQLGNQAQQLGSQLSDRVSSAVERLSSAADRVSPSTPSTTDRISSSVPSV